MLVAILALGLGLRVAEAWDGRSPVYDAVAYERIAGDLSAGDGFTLGREATQPASNYSPGVPLLVGGIYALTGGEHERLVRLVLALVGGLAVLFAYLIGRRLSGPPAGLIGACAVAIYPALLEYQGMLMGEPLAATLLSGAVLGTLWADGRGARVLSRGGGAGRALGFSPGPLAAVRVRRWGEKEDAASSRHPLPTPPARGWLLSGLLFGSLALVRPEYLAIALLVAVVILVRRGWDEWRIGLAQALVMLLGVAVVVAPWTVRNAVVLDRFVPVSTGGGQVLFAGSYLPSGGNPERVGHEVLDRHPGLTRKLAVQYAGLRSSFVAPGQTNDELTDRVLSAVRLEQILGGLAGQRYPDMETDKALGRMGRERLWDALTEQPVEYAGFVAAKVWRVWGHGPREVMQRTGWELFHWALLALATLGLGLLAWRRRWEALLLATILLSTAAVGALLVASPRRALVTIPLIATLAGVGATAAYAWLRTRIRH
ncbi:MAG: hypothetical protein WD404_05540 [Solirubrobacterales bacterium]